MNPHKLTTRQLQTLRKFVDEGRVPHGDINGYLAQRMEDWIVADEYQSYWTLTPAARRRLAEEWFPDGR